MIYTKRRYQAHKLHSIRYCITIIDWVSIAFILAWIVKRRARLYVSKQCDHLQYDLSKTVGKSNGNSYKLI